MNGQITIRRAGPADSDTLLAMMREIAAAEAVGTVDVTAERWRALLSRADVIVFIAERAGTAVGYASAVRQLHVWSGCDIVALDDLYVRADHRDGGIGKRLMTAMAEAAAPEQHFLRWEVEADNHAAQRFYQRLGASLRAKTIAAWRPDAYRTYLPRNAASPRVR